MIINRSKTNEKIDFHGKERGRDESIYSFKSKQYFLYFFLIWFISTNLNCTVMKTSFGKKKCEDLER